MKISYGVGLVLCMGLAACAGEGSDTDDDAGGGGENGGDVPAPGKNFGSVFMNSSSLGAPQSAVGAGFIEDYASFCPITVIDGCRIVDCNFRTATPGATFVSAGEVTVEGGLREVTLTPGSDATYDTHQESAALFDGGEELAVRVEGSSDVPALEAMVRAPLGATITAPVIDGPLAVDRSEPFEVSWSEWQSGEVAVSLVVGQKDDEGSPEHVITVQCRFDGADGEGAIPTEVLELLPATDETDSGTLSIAVTSMVEVEASGWTPVLVSASTTAATPGGGPATTSIETR